MTQNIDLSGIDRLRERFEKLTEPNPVALLLRVENLIDEGNRNGVLAGRDKDDRPMAPVTYRPLMPGAKSVKLTVEQRLGQGARTKRGRYSRIGSGIERNNNNLTSAEYRLLDGPPLAPRRQFSRVITNFMTSSGRTGPRVWEVIGAWINVLSRRGVPFLHFHFDGQGQRVRDLRGIRPPTMLLIRESMRNWMIDQIRSNG